MNYKHLLSSKFVFLLLMLFLGFMVNLKYKQYKSQRAIELEKQKLVEQAQELEQKNKDLNETLSYINSESFKERLARQQLNMKKEGELVINFMENDNPAEQPTSQNNENLTNPAKWWNYFFNR